MCSKNFESFLLKREMIVLTKENNRIHILNIFKSLHKITSSLSKIV